MTLGLAGQAHILHRIHRTTLIPVILTDRSSSYFDRFDPAAFAMIGPPPGVRFPVPPPPHVPMEEFEVDEHGNVDWHLAWHKELSVLQQLTTDQEKAGVDQEWYRQMLFRVRAALMMALPPDHISAAPPPPNLEQAADGSEIAHDGPPPA
jgi:forkhead box protein J2/3